jgi:hypothetical protein
LQNIFSTWSCSWLLQFLRTTECHSTVKTQDPVSSAGIEIFH